MLPLLRWPGGKSWFVASHGKIVLEHIEMLGGRYFEPFLGGAAMALFLGSRYPKRIFLSDVVEPLINTYEMLKANPVELAMTVAQIGIEYGVDEKAYYAVRDEQPEDPMFRAAQFVYLNALNFNGIYRENAKGEYNVPAGSRAKSGTAKLPERRLFDMAAMGLQLSEFECCDFEAAIAETGERDFIYVDPPYFETFGDYAKGGFGPKDQERLALALYHAGQRGATFLAHNSLGEDVRDAAGHRIAGTRYWYEDFAQIIPIDEPRRVAANGDRNKVTCALLTNDVELAARLATEA